MALLHKSNALQKSQLQKNRTKPVRQLLQESCMCFAAAKTEQTKSYYIAWKKGWNRQTNKMEENNTADGVTLPNTFCWQNEKLVTDT